MAFIRKLGNILKETSLKLPRLESSISNTSSYQAIRCFSSSNLYIGGFSYATDENCLRETFSPYGDVIEARIIFDRESGRSRGFGFVSYTSSEDASAAIQALDGRDLHGRFIKVAYAANQRHTGLGPSFAGAAGYGGSNYGGSSGYNPYGNTVYGSSGHNGDRTYSNPDIGNYDSFSSNGNGGDYRVEDGLNVGPGGNFSTQGISNGAGGSQYFHNAGDNFGGNPAVGYGCAFGGGSGYGDAFGRGSRDAHGPNGNFSTSNYRNNSTDSYSAIYGEVHSSFNDTTPYNSASQDNDYWQNHRVHTSSNSNDFSG